MASGASVSAVKVKFSPCIIKTVLALAFPVVGCRSCLSKPSSNLPCKADQSRVAQTVLHFLDRHRLGRQGRPWLGCLPENGVVQHRKKVLEIRKADRLYHVAQRQSLNLAALNAQPAGLILEE